MKANIPLTPELEGHQQALAEQAQATEAALDIQERSNRLQHRFLQKAKFMGSVACVTLFGGLAGAAPAGAESNARSPVAPQPQTEHAASSSSTSSKVVIGLVDTGFDASRADTPLPDIIPGFNVFTNSTQTTDIEGHGTQVAQWFRKYIDESPGAKDVCEDKCVVAPYQTYSDETIEGSVESLEKGFDKALDDEVDVINFSVGPNPAASWVPTQSFSRLMEKAKQTDTSLSFAPGNSSSSNPTINRMASYPSPVGITTAGMSANGRSLLRKTNYGKNWVHMAALGSDEEISAVDGSSWAAPAATIATAALEAFNPKLTAIEKRKLILENGDKKKWLEGKVNTGMVINMDRALKAAGYRHKKAAVMAVPLGRERGQVKVAGNKKGFREAIKVRVAPDGDVKLRATKRVEGESGAIFKRWGGAKARELCASTKRLVCSIKDMPFRYSGKKVKLYAVYGSKKENSTSKR